MLVYLIQDSTLECLSMLNISYGFEHGIHYEMPDDLMFDLIPFDVDL